MDHEGSISLHEWENHLPPVLKSKILSQLEQNGGHFAGLVKMVDVAKVVYVKRSNVKMSTSLTKLAITFASCMFIAVSDSLL